jgi:cytochrome c oxidase cbb3-type subunit 4
MLAFVALVIWAWSSRRKADFDEMAQMPFREEPQQNKGANSDE